MNIECQVFMQVKKYSVFLLTKLRAPDTRFGKIYANFDILIYLPIKVPALNPIKYKGYSCVYHLV